LPIFLFKKELNISGLIEPNRSRANGYLDKRFFYHFCLCAANRFKKYI